MQVPSCTNVRIRSTADVHKIFYAVYLGLLPMITRRLDAKEREALSSGYCYAWEDRGPHAITGIGIERFTEGRHWSASRVRDVCASCLTSPPCFLTTISGILILLRKMGASQEQERGESQVSRSCSCGSRMRFNPTAILQSDGQPPRDWDPYVKQTYSVYLNENENNKRKWHLSASFSSRSHPSLSYDFLAAYFTQATVDRLGTVDDIPVLKDLVVPENLFKSSRRTKTRSSRANTSANAPDAAPLSNSASSSGKPGRQISVAGPSSTASRPTPQVVTQPAAPPQMQGLPPPNTYHQQDLFTPQPPTYSGLPTNTAPPAAQQHDAYTRIYTGDYASPQPPENYHVPPSPHIQSPVSPFGYNWQAPPTSVSDHSCQSPYSYPVLVASQNGDSTFHHSPAQSQLYVYGSGFQTSPQSLLNYRNVSPALSHAPSQFSASSQSQSSSESESPAPGPVALRTPVFSPERLSVVLPTDGENKYETVSLQGIREHDGTIDSMALASLESLKRFHPYRRDPLDDRVVQRLSRPV